MSTDDSQPQPQQQLSTGIVDPNDSDVLCGRGGAALRHPGNQTYRRLVNLNKGLYTTCLKTEKLKISRSIVAAIREQQGRFLEKDAKSNTWYDIGDKKAIEKTSQALREGQPKLRQKIVEMGGAPSIDQYGHAGGMGFDPPLGGLGGMDPALMDQALMDPSALMMPPPPQMSHQVSSSSQQQRMGSQSSFPNEFQNEIGQAMSQSQAQPPSAPPRMGHGASRSSVAAAAQTAAMREQEIRSMQPPMPDPARQEMHAEMFQRPSLRAMSGGGGDDSQEDAIRQQQQQQQQQHLQQQQQRVARAMRPSLAQRHAAAPHELGLIESQLSLASEFSAFAGQSGNSLMSLEAASFRRAAQGNNNNNNTSTNNNGSLYGLYGNNESSNNNYFAPQGGGGVNTGSTNNNVGSNGGGSFSPRHGMTNGPAVVTSGGGGGGGGHGGGAAAAAAQSSMGAAGAGMGSGAIPPRDKLAGMDRRHVFAKMKYSRPPSVRGPGGMTTKSPYSSNHQSSGMSQFSLGDGMPDIHMVESSMSLYSNVSNMTDGLSRLDLESAHETSQPADQKPSFQSSPERSRMPEQGRDINWGGGHTGASSVMSLSRIDDVSIDNSIFSDLSKKMSNMSTRSVAMSMSEISVLDLQEGDNEDDDSGNANPEFAARKMDAFAVPVQHRRQEYDLS